MKGGEARERETPGGEKKMWALDLRGGILEEV